MSFWHKTIKDIIVILERSPLDAKSMKEAKELMKTVDIQDQAEYNKIWDDIEEGSLALKSFIQTVHHNCRALIERGDWATARYRLLDANRLGEKAKEKFKRITKEIVKL